VLATKLAASYLKNENLDLARQWIAKARLGLSDQPEGRAVDAAQRIATAQLATALAEEQQDKLLLLETMRQHRAELRAAWPERVVDIDPLAEVLLAK